MARMSNLDNLTPERIEKLAYISGGEDYWGEALGYIANY